MARAADNFFNPRRNFEIEVNAAGLYDYVKKFQLGYFPAGSLPDGTIAINIDVDEFASQVICVKDRATGVISKVDAGDITLMPRGNQNFTDIEDETGSKNLPALQVHNFEKYLIPGDFEETFSTALNYSTAITRFLRKYELSCLEYSRTFAQYLQNYFYIACINNNPQSTTYLFQKPQALVNYYNALEDNDLIKNTLQIWSSIFHAGIDKNSAIYNYFSILYSLPLPGAATPLAITGKPYVGSLASAEDQNLSVEIVERENRDMTHSNINLPASEAWTLVIVANLNGFPASGYINFEMGGISAYDGLAITTGGIFVFIDKDGNPTTFTTSFNPWFGRTAIIHLQYTPTTGSPQGTFKLYINGELLETRAGYGATMVNRLFNSNVSAQPSGKYYLRRIAQGQTPNNTQVLNEATALRAIFPEFPSVVIGSQEWTVENCNQVTTALGYTIPEVTNAAAWAALTTPAWCYYDNNPANGAIYGKLYNWYAIKIIADHATAYNLTAPENRKIKFNSPPTLRCSNLNTFLGVNAGSKMKKPGILYFNAPNSGATNDSKFSGLGSGYRSTSGAFAGLKDYCWMWNTTDYGAAGGSHYLRTSLQSYNVVTSLKNFGFSLRLVKI